MSLLRLLLIPATAFAQRTLSLKTWPGTSLSFLQILENIISFIVYTASGFFTLLFIVGAGMLTLSRGDQTKVDNGKKLMVSSLIGIALVLGSYGIDRTILYFIYEWAP